MNNYYRHEEGIKSLIRMVALVVFCAFVVADVAVVALCSSGLVDLALLVWTLAACGM